MTHIISLSEEELIALFNHNNPDQYSTIHYLTKQQIIDKYSLTEDEIKKYFPSDNI